MKMMHRKQWLRLKSHLKRMKKKEERKAFILQMRERRPEMNSAR